MSSLEKELREVKDELARALREAVGNKHELVTLLKKWVDSKDEKIEELKDQNTQLKTQTQ